LTKGTRDGSNNCSIGGRHFHLVVGNDQTTLKVISWGGNWKDGKKMPLILFQRIWKSYPLKTESRAR